MLVLAPTGKDAALTASVLDRAGVACVCCPDLERGLRGAGARRRAPCCWPEEAVVGGPDRLPDRMAGPPAAVVRPAGAGPGTARGRLRRGGAGHGPARQRHGAGAADARRGAGERRPHGAAGAAAAVPDPRPPRRTRTQRRRRRRSLPPSSRRSDDAIISKTLDGIILTWNAGAERLFGYSAAEAIGQPITLLIPPERHDEERGAAGTPAPRRAHRPLRDGPRHQGRPADRYLLDRVSGSGLRRARSSAPRRSRATSRERKQAEARAARRRPPQGRVPGHPRPRAAQPTGADPQFAAHPAADQPARPGRRARRRDDGAAGQPHGAPGGRPAGGLAHHPRQDRAAQGTASRWPPSSAARGNEPAAHRGRRPPAGPGDPPRAADRGRRSRPPDPGLRQPAEQRGQVHRRRRADLAHGPPRGRMGGHFGARHGHGHSARDAPARLRLVHADRSPRRPRPGRSGHRPDAGQEPRRNARRQRPGAQRRTRAGQRIRGPPAAGVCTSARPTFRRTPRPSTALLAPRRVLVVDDNRDAAESLGMLLKLLGADVHVAYNGPDALEALRDLSSRPSCCSTSACRAWTATRWRGGSGSNPSSRT